MQTIGQRRRALGAMLQRLRADAGKKYTLEYVAQEMNVSRNTISAWESGSSVPDLLQLEDLEDLYGVNPISRLIRYRNPHLFEKDADTEKARVIEYIQNVAPPLVVRQLDFLFFGSHGSDSIAIMQEMNAILQLPLVLRYHVASTIKNMLELAQISKKQNCPDEVMPDMETWQEAIDAGLRAASEGRSEYGRKLK